MEARCQCKLISFICPLPRPSKIYICHCNECRIESGSAFGITADFPGFPFPPPELKEHLGIYTRQGLSGMVIDGYFCKRCGTRVLHQSPEDPNQVGVRGGCLVGLTKEMMKDKELVVHCWTSNAVVDIPEGFKQWEKQ